MEVVGDAGDGGGDDGAVLHVGSVCGFVGVGRRSVGDGAYEGDEEDGEVEGEHD